MGYVLNAENSTVEFIQPVNSMLLEVEHLASEIKILGLEQVRVIEPELVFRNMVSYVCNTGLHVMETWTNRERPGPPDEVYIVNRRK